jgi:hypothetical protein
VTSGRMLLQEPCEPTWRAGVVAVATLLSVQKRAWACCFVCPPALWFLQMVRGLVSQVHCVWCGGFLVGWLFVTTQLSR